MINPFKTLANRRENSDNLLPANFQDVVSKIRNYVKSNPVKEFKGVKSKSPLEVTVKDRARFVRLSLQTLVSFHLDTIEILDKKGRNLAKAQKTIISSKYNDEEKHDGRGALVGRKNGGCGFHTKREHSPWIVIDLGNTQEIEKIVVYNREGKFYTRALSLKVEISSDLVSWKELFDNWKMLNTFKKTNPSEFENAVIHAFILDPAPSTAFLKKLKAQATDAEALKFQSCINDIVKERGVAFGPHGFVKTFELRSEEEKDQVASELAKVLHWLNSEFGTPAFISSGTLLGLVRDGKFIEHDDDVDICYISNKSDEVAILEERQQLVEFLQNKGCKLTPSGIAHYWCKTPAGQSLDIFTGFIEDDKCSMNPISRNEISVTEVLPLKSITYRGETLYLPANPERLLEVNYGSSWKSPDPLWSFNWGKAQRNFGFLYF